MEERLPGITVQPHIDTKIFFDRLHEVAQGQSNWCQSRFEEKPGVEGDCLLEFEYQGTTPKLPKSLIVQFIHAPKHDTNRVRVEMKARNWGAPGLTYDSYVAMVVLVKPLLVTYNRSYNTRLRLIIQSRNALIPRLHPKAREFFDVFVSLANKSGLHPYDWGRFYDFILVSHRLRIRQTEEDVAYLLALDGFDDDHASRIANVYKHGRAILQRPRNPILTRRWAEMQGRWETEERHQTGPEARTLIAEIESRPQEVRAMSRELRQKFEVVWHIY